MSNAFAPNQKKKLPLAERRARRERREAIRLARRKRLLSQNLHVFGEPVPAEVPKKKLKKKRALGTPPTSVIVKPVKTKPAGPPMSVKHQARLTKVLRREKIRFQGEVLRSVVGGRGQLTVRVPAAEKPMVELLLDGLKLRTPVVIQEVPEV
jgi:hypothetical protein